jgi:hypothetical protein
MIINKFQDIRQFIADQRLSCPSMYVSHYVEIVAIEFAHLLESKGFSWSDNLNDYDISDEEFWDCFTCAEKTKNFDLLPNR